MSGFISIILKALTSGLFGFIERQIMGWKRARSLKKIGYFEAKEKADDRNIKTLRKVEKKRARLRSDSKYADKLRRKYTRH